MAHYAPRLPLKVLIPNFINSKTDLNFNMKGSWGNGNDNKKKEYKKRTKFKYSLIIIKN